MLATFIMKDTENNWKIALVRTAWFPKFADRLAILLLL